MSIESRILALEQRANFSRQAENAQGAKETTEALIAWAQHLSGGAPPEPGESWAAYCSKHLRFDLQAFKEWLWLSEGDFLAFIAHQWGCTVDEVLKTIPDT